MKSALFHTDRYKEIGERIKTFVNEQAQFLSASTADSPRAVGDAVQEILADEFEGILGKDICAKYSRDFARRAMADMAFEDKDGFYYVVDVKTHRLDTKFNMPNLTSVERLARFYEDDRGCFVVLMIAYEIQSLRALVQEVTLAPIEFFDWGCLTIGALGWGQIQIADANRIVVNPQSSRRQWMIQLCDMLFDFHPRELKKIEARVEHFRKVREYWANRPD